jgi:hypothetical protein
MQTSLPTAKLHWFVTVTTMHTTWHACNFLPPHVHIGTAPPAPPTLQPREPSAPQRTCHCNSTSSPAQHQHTFSPLSNRQQPLLPSLTSCTTGPTTSGYHTPHVACKSCSWKPHTCSSCTWEVSRCMRRSGAFTTGPPYNETATTTQRHALSANLMQGALQVVGQESYWTSPQDLAACGHWTAWTSWGILKH